MATNEKQDNLFLLIKSLNKAEKRNFKLFATRLDGNTDAKFIALFDCLDHLDRYDQKAILQRCKSITKQQLPNMKAHLYKQIMKSLRMLNAQHSITLQIKEQIDFANILFDKGLYQQAEKLLEKAAQQAKEFDEAPLLLDIITLHKRVKVMNVSSDMTRISEKVIRESESIFRHIESINNLSKMAIRMLALHQEIGYARSQKDLDMLNNYIKPKLDGYDRSKMNFAELFYYFQARAWYYYVRHEFSKTYRYARLWVELFNKNPHMKEVMYDNYLMGYSQFFEGLFLMRRYSLYMDNLEKFEAESGRFTALNANAEMIVQQILFTGRLNKSLLDGTYKEGLWYTKSIDSYMKKYADYLSIYEKMALDYKIACLYFYDNNYAKCMEYLSYIIAVKDPKIRRDLQCYARILNLLALYDAGMDFNIDYQIRSVYYFLVKMKDMTGMKNEIFAFFKRLGTIKASDFKTELKTLYTMLKPYENHPYERRTFYYIDMLSWLESKITERSMGEITRERFEREQAAEKLKKRETK